MKSTKFDTIAQLCTYLLADNNAPHVQHKDDSAEFVLLDYEPPTNAPKTWKILIYQDF